MRKVRVFAVVTGEMIGLLAAVALLAGPATGPAAAAATGSVGVPVQAAQSAVVNMAALAAQDAARPLDMGPGTGVMVAPGPPSPFPPHASPPLLLSQLLAAAGGRTSQPPSPSPAQSFAGLDDIADLSTGLRWVPPDTDGAVGLTKVMSGLNNDYRIWSKATGEVVSTVSPNTFWGAVGGKRFFDPRTLYDPINDRWLVVMLADPAAAGSAIDIGVSQTSDPSGSYFLFRVPADAAGTTWADFPTVGFNKDYVAVGVNMYTNSNTSYVDSKILAVDYRALRTGTLRGWYLHGSPAWGSNFCSAPAATYSTSASTLYVIRRPWEVDGSYQVNTITGDPSTGPVYTVGAIRDRGLAWFSGFTGNMLPQKPTAGSPHPVGIFVQDDMIRSSPVVRDGFIYFTQTVGFPADAADATRSSILWTKLTASTGAVADGGLIDDPTATATNGGKWYSYPHIAVNRFGDIIVGYSQFSSEQWASAGYSVHVASDPPGTMRAPVIYKAGEDIYQKKTSDTRNRWGDYSKAQIDPSNDADLWVVNEYAKPVTGPADKGGVWGTWWAKVTSPTRATLSIIASAGPHGAIDPSGWMDLPPGGSQRFTITAERGYHVADVRVDGRSVGAVTSYDFVNVTRDHTISAAFAIDTYTITPRVGTAGHGFVSPALPQTVTFASTPTFTFSPERGYYASRLTVDGVAVGFSGPNRYTFAPVDGSHVLQVFFTVAPRQALR